MIQRNRAAAAALVLLVATLSITLGMVAAGPRADALVPVPVPIAIGETLAGPAAETLAGSACVGTIVCGAVVGTAALGVAAYATRDTWLPAVKKLLGNDDDVQQTTGVIVSNNPKDTTNPNCAATGTVTFKAGVLGGSVSWSGCQYMTGGVHLVVTRWTCQDSAGKVTTGSEMPNFGGPSDGSQSTQHPGAFRLDVPNQNGNFPTGTIKFADKSPCLGTGNKLINGTAVLHHNGTGGIHYTDFQNFGGAVPDADVSQTTTVRCVGGAAGSGTDLTRTQVGHPDQIIVPSCWSAYPGSYPANITTTYGTQGNEKSLFNLPLMNPTTNYPECFNSAGAYKSGCRVRVWINGQPCTVGATHCANWERADDDFGDKVECRWGPYPVQLDDCDMLKTQYRSDTKVKKLTTTDPKTGAAADPADLPATGASTGASTGTSTGQSTFPSTGTNPDTGTSPGAGGAPEPSESSESNTKNCWGSGWSWNPISWVYVPVRCALKWAFVPPAGTFTLTDVAAQLSARPPGSVVVEVGGLLKTTFGAYSSSNGCAPVGFGSQSGRALEVDCNGLQGSGVGRALYSLAGVAVIVGAGIACWRIVAGAVDR